MLSKGDLVLAKHYKDLREDSDRDCGYYGFLYKKLILENPECVEYLV